MLTNSFTWQMHTRDGFVIGLNGDVYVKHAAPTSSESDQADGSDGKRHTLLTARLR